MLVCLCSQSAGVLGRFFFLSFVAPVVVIYCVLTFGLFVYNSILAMFEEFNIYCNTDWLYKLAYI